MKFQQRAHLWPEAGSALTAGSGPEMTRTAETLRSSFRPPAWRRSNSSSSPEAAISRSASRPLPIRLPWRASSRTRIASSRTAKSCFHSSSTGCGSCANTSSGFGNSARCTLTGRPSTRGRYSQISSAVKLRTGATRRTSASVIFHSTVCAERRAWLAGAKVYIRSFRTSR